jgi:hypothetical protein
MTWRICLQIFLQVSLEHSKPHLMVLFKMESDMLCTIVLVEYVGKPDAASYGFDVRLIARLTAIFDYHGGKITRWR